VTLAIIGWIAFTILFFYLASFLIDTDIDPDVDPDSPSVQGWRKKTNDNIQSAFTLGAGVVLFIIVPISCGIQYDLFGYFSPDQTLFRIMGYLLLALTSIIAVALIISRRRSYIEDDQDREYRDQGQSTYTSRGRFPFTLTQIFGLIVAVTSLVASILQIIDFYLEH